MYFEALVSSKGLILVDYNFQQFWQLPFWYETSISQTFPLLFKPFSPAFQTFPLLFKSFPLLFKPSPCFSNLFPCFSNLFHCFSNLFPCFSNLSPAFQTFSTAFQTFSTAFQTFSPAFQTFPPAFQTFPPAFQTFTPAFQAFSPAFQTFSPAFQTFSPAFFFYPDSTMVDKGQHKKKTFFFFCLRCGLVEVHDGDNSSIVERERYSYIHFMSWKCDGTRNRTKTQVTWSNIVLNLVGKPQLETLVTDKAQKFKKMYISSQFLSHPSFTH